MPPSALRTLAVAFLCFWIGLLAHEGAHFAVGRVVYGTFRPSQADVEHVSQSQRALPVTGGPAMTTLILVVAAAMASGLGTGGRWAAAMMAAGAASRLALIGRATLLAQGSNDEQTIGHLLNVSARAIWTSEAVLSGLALWWIWRLLPPSGRLQTAAWIAVAIILGWFSAVTFGVWIGLPI